MKIYIDSDFKCFTAPGDGLTEVETDFFDGKCAAYIEGYRFVPAGQSWTREDGEVFAGEMASPWKMGSKRMTKALATTLTAAAAGCTGSPLRGSSVCE